MPKTCRAYRHKKTVKKNKKKRDKKDNCTKKKKYSKKKKKLKAATTRSTERALTADWTTKHATWRKVTERDKQKAKNISSRLKEGEGEPPGGESHARRGLREEYVEGGLPSEPWRSSSQTTTPKETSLLNSSLHILSSLPIHYVFYLIPTSLSYQSSTSLNIESCQCDMRLITTDCLVIHGKMWICKRSATGYAKPQSVSSLPSMESIVGISKKGEDERGAMGGRRSRPLGTVGNIHWKEKHVYTLSHWGLRLGAGHCLRESSLCRMSDGRATWGPCQPPATIIIAFDWTQKSGHGHHAKMMLMIAMDGAQRQVWSINGDDDLIAGGRWATWNDFQPHEMIFSNSTCRRW